MSDVPELLSTSEAAAVLHVSRDTVVRLVHAGSLRYVDLSTGNRPRIRIRRDDLAAWIEQHTKTEGAGT